MPDEPTTARATFGTFVWAIVLGMGFTVGVGLIKLVVWVAAKAVGQDVPINP